MKLEPVTLPPDTKIPLKPEALVAYLELWRLDAWELGLFAGEGADLMCGTATELFLEYLVQVVNDSEAKNLNPTTYMFLFQRPEHRDAYPVNLNGYTGNHVVAVIGNLMIDWSARQFDQRAPCPLIFKDPTKTEK